MPDFTGAEWNDEITVRSFRDERLFVPGRQSDIMFHFKCKCNHQELIRPFGFDEAVHIESYNNEYDFRRYFSDRNLTSMPDDVRAHVPIYLSTLFLPEDFLQEVVELVTIKVREGLENLPQGHNVVQVNCSITAIYCYVEDELSDAESAIFGSLETYDPHMVPTADSVIEKLKTVVIPVGSEEGKCMVCLEEMNGGCVATALLCGHLFHGDCINLWLRTSHYCPLCRYVMPMAAEDDLAI